MAVEQYRIGTVNVTQNSNIIVGVGTLWLANIQVGNLFKLDVDGEPVYTVASITDDTHIVLTVNYAGATASGQAYLIQRSFTPVRGYARPFQTDADITDIMRWNIDKLDNDTTVLTLPQINDTSANHQYIFAVSELTADRIVTLPLLTGNDEFVFKDFAAILTNKTIAFGSNTITGTSAQLATAITDKTGTGLLVFATLPTFGSFNFGEVQTVLASTKKHTSTIGENVFIGGGGQSITWDGVNSYTGSKNVAIGVNALYSLITGYDAVAIGYNALYSHTSGYWNTALGMNALYSLTTGYQNIGVGHNALYALTTGYMNVGIGHYALDSVLTGYFNTAVGHDALSSATGMNNTAIGYQSGNDALITLTTESNYVIVGNNNTTNAFIKVAWTIPSDVRDKTDFGIVPHGIDFVNKLNPISYQYKTSREDDTPAKDGRVRYGFLAQDILLLEGDKSVIIDNRDKENLKYNESSLIPVLVKAMQEQQVIIDNLQKKVEILYE